MWTLLSGDGLPRPPPALTRLAGSACPGSSLQWGADPCPGCPRRQTTPFPAVTPTPDLSRDHASHTLSRQLSA